jgi:hypothetical protein
LVGGLSKWLAKGLKVNSSFGEVDSDFSSDEHENRRIVANMAV